MTKKKTVAHKRAQSNPAVKAAQDILTLAEPKGGGELTDTQQKRLLGKCESTISANVEAYYAVGVALATIRDRGLYKIDGSKTFEAYCQAKWSFGRARAYQLIEAADVVTNVNNCRQNALPLPSNEAQARPLAKLPPEQQINVWKKVVDSVPEGKVTAKIVAEAVAESAPEDASDSVFNPTNDNIDWAKWSWNPVTGCHLGCSYCYARSIAERFRDKFPKGFQPHFRKERLVAPKNTKIPKGREREPGVRNVFVCSMADLFGEWVPQKWIDAVLKAVAENPQWNFLFLTKNPARLVGIEWPANAWVGTTVDRQARVKPAIAAFQKIKAPVRFLSCEPLLEELTFPTLDCFDWVIIGAQSASGAEPEIQPDSKWVQGLVNQAWTAGKPVYFKPNLRSAVREYPDHAPPAPYYGAPIDLPDLIARIDPNHKPVWDGMLEPHQEALARYFLRCNSNGKALEPTRPKVVKWYGPFACQRSFPSGHRYVINTYTGCSFNCTYCYARGYGPPTASPKDDFHKLIDADMEDLERFAVPPAPVHISNSTDPFQPLEREKRHTRHALEQILAHRGRFTTVTLLTKNPSLPVKDGYIDLFKQLMVSPVNPEDGQPFSGIPFEVQVSLAFWREAARKAYDGNAPTVASRCKGIEALTVSGIPVVLRVDPLFPRLPLGTVEKSMKDFGLTEPQSLDDLENLVMFAKDAGVSRIIYSAAKIVRARGGMDETMKSMLEVYREIAVPDKLKCTGGTWRLPLPVVKQHIETPFLEICGRLGVKAAFCMHDLVVAGRAKPVEVIDVASAAPVEGRL